MSAVGFARTANPNGGDGQTTTQPTYSLTIPAGASVGDKATLVINADGTPSFTVGGDPANNGWSLVAIIGGGSFPQTGSGSSSVWVFEKTLAPGDPGASFSWTFSTSIRGGGILGTFSGRGTPTVAVATDSSATGTYTLPTTTAVAGTDVFAVWPRRRSGAAPASVTVPAPYTSPANGEYFNAFAAGVNTYGDSGYVENVAAGTVGGESATTGVTAVGYSLLILLPPGDVSIPVAPAVAGPALASVTPQVAPDVPPARAGTAVGGGLGVTVSSGVLPAVAGPAGSGGVEPGTAAPIAPAVAGPATGAPFGVSLDAGVAPAVAGPALGGQVGGSAAVPIGPAVAGPATGTEVLGVETYRYQWWDGNEWQPIHPQVWDGATFRTDIPVTVVPADS